MRQRTYHQRVVYGADLDLEFVPLDANGDPRNPDSIVTPPTVAVTRVSNGTAIASVDDVAVPAEKGQPYTARIAAAKNTDVDEYVAVWTIDGVDHTRRVQLVGGVYFDLDEAEAAGHDVFPGAKPGEGRLRRARAIAELECERLTGVAFVPQMAEFAEMVKWSDPELLVPDPSPSLLRGVDVHDTTGAVSSSWTAAELAAVHCHSDYGSIERLSGCWPTGKITVRYNHGFERPPGDLAEMVARRYVWWLSKPESAIPDTAVSWSPAEGGNFRLDKASPGKTGDRDVDAVYLDYRNRLDRVGIA